MGPRHVGITIPPSSPRRRGPTARTIRQITGAKPTAVSHPHAAPKNHRQSHPPVIATPSRHPREGGDPRPGPLGKSLELNLPLSYTLTRPPRTNDNPTPRHPHTLPSSPRRRGPTARTIRQITGAKPTAVLHPHAAPKTIDNPTPRHPPTLTVIPAEAGTHCPDCRANHWR